MSFFVAPLQRLLQDFLHDVKSSKRFWVATIMWIPLFITVMIAISELGLRNTYSKRTLDWRTRYENEDSGISFPDVTIQLGAGGAQFSVTPGQLPLCKQRMSLATRSPCPGALPTKCNKFSLSQFQASAAYEGQNHITCSLIITTQSPQDNTEFNVTVPQGFIWQPNPPTYVQANRLAEVDLYRERLVTMDHRSADEWFTTVTYQTSDFYSPDPTTGYFNATIMFRIPVRAMIVHYQYNAFDQWQLIGTWGGAIFFMWFLHSIVYGILKLWLPNDSKLFPATDAPTTTYEPIK